MNHRELQRSICRLAASYASCAMRTSSAGLLSSTRHMHLTSNGGVSSTESGRKLDRNHLHELTKAINPSISSAMALRLEGLWQNFSKPAYYSALAVSTYGIWTLLCNVSAMMGAPASALSDAKMFGISAALIGGSAMFLRYVHRIDQEYVTRRVLRKLNASTAVLEVMGAPLVANPARALILTGGGIAFDQGLFPRVRPQRLQMSFPLTGSDRTGMATVEAIKNEGQYNFKLVAVDVDPGSSQLPPARVFVVGNEDIYIQRSAIKQLCDPLIKAVQMEKEMQYKDAVDEAQAAEQRKQQEQEHSQLLATLTNEATTQTSQSSSSSTSPPPPSSTPDLASKASMQTSQSSSPTPPPSSSTASSSTYASPPLSSTSQSSSTAQHSVGKQEVPPAADEQPTHSTPTAATASPQGTATAMHGSTTATHVTPSATATHLPPSATALPGSSTASPMPGATATPAAAAAAASGATATPGVADTAGQTRTPGTSVQQKDK